MDDHFTGSIDDCIVDPKFKEWNSRPFHFIGPGSDFIDDFLKYLNEGKNSEKN